MTKTEDGGVAFPDTIHSGMSLRDWFAGMALQAMAIHLVDGPNPHEDMAADMAYRYADAMLKQRDK